MKKDKKIEGKNNNAEHKEDSSIGYYGTFLIINLIFSLAVGFLLSIFKIPNMLIYVIISFLLSSIIVLFYKSKNKEKISNKKSDLFVYWIIIVLIYFGAAAFFLGISFLINSIKIIYGYDFILMGLFCFFVGVFLFEKRKNLKREGLMYLYRTRVGIKFIDFVGNKYKRTLKILSYFSVIFGYILMVVMIYLLGQLAYIYFKAPEIVRAIKVPPLMPLIPYLPSLFKIDFLPPFYFTYWIIAIAIIAVFHEFSHGIFARYNGIKIKTTGFGFLGPFLAAFVEPDEKQMQSKSKFAQITVLSAGTFTNLILSVIFLLLLSVFFVFSYAPAGALFNTYTPGIINLSYIKEINGLQINNTTKENLLLFIKQNDIKDDYVLGSNGNFLNLSRISTENKNYYLDIESLKSQIETSNDLALYEDLPAINVGLRGAIIEINGQKIMEYNDLAKIMEGYKPGQTIKVKTKVEKDIYEYNITLAENPNNSSRAVMGIGFLKQNTRLMREIVEFFNFFKKEATYYEPRYNSDLVIFIYNLIWWIGLVNISVALINMLPMGIFDGGRMFMLTVWAVTKSEKFAQVAFRVMTYLILGVFLLLMFSWFAAFF